MRKYVVFYRFACVVELAEMQDAFPRKWKIDFVELKFPSRFSPLGELEGACGAGRNAGCIS